MTKASVLSEISFENDYRITNNQHKLHSLNINSCCFIFVYFFLQITHKLSPFTVAAAVSTTIFVTLIAMVFDRIVVKKQADEDHLRQRRQSLIKNKQQLLQKWVLKDNTGIFTNQHCIVEDFYFILASSLFSSFLF